MGGESGRRWINGDEGCRQAASSCDVALMKRRIRGLSATQCNQAGMRGRGFVQHILHYKILIDPHERDSRAQSYQSSSLL